MKLIQKFSMWYLFATFFVLVIGGIFSYENIKEEVDQEQARYLKKNIDFTLNQLNNGVIPDSLSQNKIEVILLTGAAQEQEFLIQDTLVWHGYLKRMDPQIKVSTIREIRGQNYYISTYGAIVDTGDITHTVFKSSIALFFGMLLVSGIISILISRKLLAPFNKTLKEIQAFRLNQKQAVHFPATHTLEFKKLNAFLQEMTSKAQEDYQNLKEFTENASHELQTPLAIIRGKLELMMDSDLNNRQANLISSAHTAVEKLSKIGQSLTLLTKLDNQEFRTSSSINLSQQVKESLVAFQELVDMKSLRVRTEIADNVHLKIHPLLCTILLNNLFSNAIRHNVESGDIHIHLDAHCLEISNTGDPLNLPPAELFKRFKKNNASSDSIGLGLAIVKRICEQSNVEIMYSQEPGRHLLRLRF